MLSGLPPDMAESETLKKLHSWIRQELTNQQLMDIEHVPVHEDRSRR